MEFLNGKKLKKNIHPSFTNYRILATLLQTFDIMLRVSDSTKKSFILSKK